MSVSQIKKRFEELAVYLNRDVVGQEKLKKLKDDVNALRTQLATAEVKAADAVALAAATRRRAEVVERELVAATHELQRLRQVNQNLSRDLTLANARIAAADAQPAEPEDASPTSEQELKLVMKRLQQKLKHCPRPRGVVHKSHKDTVRVWDRNSIAQGWSHEALWILGASVAVLAAADGLIALRTSDRAKDIECRCGDPNSDANVARQMVQWMERCIDWGNDGVYHTGLARLKNYKPDLGLNAVLARPPEKKKPTPKETA